MVSDVPALGLRDGLRHGLNPCSNGIWSLTMWIAAVLDTAPSLNPCSNGIWSLTTYVDRNGDKVSSLNPCSNGIWSLTRQEQGFRLLRRHVLILVLMEYGL